MSPHIHPLLTIGIKALNEEARIGSCLTSACAAIRDLQGEVVLADSGSHDDTIPIALTFVEKGEPVRIIRLSDDEPRCCGIAAQLAFQEASGSYFYLLDGDMVLDPLFIEQGLAFLEANPAYAAVGGRVIEAQTKSIEFQLRARSDLEKGSAVSGEVDRLDCGGLYRTAAIESVGYFADRNLHAFEEFELGARLRAQGWKLARIPVPAVHHYGHADDGYHLMVKRIRSGYAGGPGEVVRAALPAPHRNLVVRDFSQLRNGIAVWGWWTALLGSLLIGSWTALTALIAIPVAFLTWRRGSLRLGCYSLATWNVNAIGLLQGLVRPRVAPQTKIRATPVFQ